MYNVNTVVEVHWGLTVNDQNLGGYMANVDPVASAVRGGDTTQRVIGETQVRISSESARKLSTLAEANELTRTQMMERLINNAKA